MKKLLFTALFLMGIAQFASASPIDCGILMAPNSSTTFITSTCTVNPDPGFFISVLTLTATDDYTGLQTGTPTVTFAANLQQSSTVFSGLTYCAVTGGPCADTTSPSATVSSLDLSTYSVSLINGSNTVTGGTVLGASIGLRLDYGETLLPVGAVPEPTTIALMSGALLGLGLLARRKKISEARD